MTTITIFLKTSISVSSYVSVCVCVFVFVEIERNFYILRSTDLSFSFLQARTKSSIQI